MRILRRGSTYQAPDGVRHTRSTRAEQHGKTLYPAGTVYSFVGGRMTVGRSAEFDISPEVFAHDPTLWEPTPEEVDKVRKDKAAKEIEWYKAHGGKEMPKEEREALEKEGALAPATKEIPGSEVREETPKRGRPVVTKG